MPAAQLGAIGKIGVFGESVVLPAASVVDRVATPDACGAVEIKEKAAAGARGMFDDEMPVEQDGFDFRERGIIAVDVTPARLHHGELLVGEVRHGTAQKIGGREKKRAESGGGCTPKGH